MSKRYFLYTRKSIDNEERQIISIEAQLIEGRLFAEREKLVIKREFTEAMTAKAPGRPVFNEMLDRIEKGEAHGIIAWHPDRLARNSMDGGRLVYLLDRQLLQSLKFPTFWFENTPQGKFMLNIAFGQSKYYIDNLSENIKRGNRQVLRRGEWPMRSPFGYFRDKVSRRQVIDPVTGPAVRTIFELYASGDYTLQSLSKKMEQLKIRNTRGGKIYASQVHYHLTNTFYYGVMNLNGDTYIGNHEPIITKELFDDVQKILHRKSQPHRRARIQAAFRGFAHCSKCGCMVTVEFQKKHFYYHCTGRRVPCHQGYVREELLESQITEGIRAILLPDDELDAKLTTWSENQTQQNPNLMRHHSAWQERIPERVSKIDTMLKRLLDAHLDGAVTLDEYRAKREDLLSRKLGWEEKLSQWRHDELSAFSPVVEFLDMVTEARALIDGDDRSAKKKFIQRIGENFKIADRRLTFDYREPWATICKPKFEYHGSCGEKGQMLGKYFELKKRPNQRLN